MTVFLNGRFLPEELAVVSVFDRSFLYGDGLFETLPIQGGKPLRWQQHLERLARGAEFLRLRLPFGPDELLKFVTQLVEQNQMPDAVLRITLSRGVGPRGYSPKGANEPILVMSLHPAPSVAMDHPPQWRLLTTSLRLPAGEPLAQFKTCNKLAQILARAEAEAGGADEGLLLNTEGEVAEAAGSNLFWVRDNVVETPPLASGILAGVTRAVVLELCQSLCVPAREKPIRPEALRVAEGVFLSLSTMGVVEAISLDGQPLRRSPLTAQIRAAYQALARNRACNSTKSAEN